MDWKRRGLTTSYLTRLAMPTCVMSSLVLTGCPPGNSTPISEELDELAERFVRTMASDDWANDIWGLGGLFPNNSEEETFDVTIDTGDVSLDFEVTIDSLTIVNDGVLRVIGGEDAVLNVVGDDGITLEGELRAGNGASINISGPFDIDDNGWFSANEDDPSASSKLTTGKVTVYEAPVGGIFAVRDNMQVTVEGDFRLAEPRTVGTGTSCTPPELTARNNALIQVEGDLIMEEEPLVTYTSTESMRLRGDFDNQSKNAANFRWADSGLTLNGSIQRIEASGQDRGAVENGFEENFAIGRLTVSADTAVTFSDLRDNDGEDGGSCSEAIYIDTLTLEAGSRVVISNSNVYVRTLDDQGATITEIDCGQLVELR